MMSLLGITGAKRFALRCRRKSAAKKAEIEDMKKITKRKRRGGLDSAEMKKKREEAERKARRGEIDPTHEFTFHLIGQVIEKQRSISMC